MWTELWLFSRALGWWWLLVIGGALVSAATFILQAAGWPLGPRTVYAVCAVAVFAAFFFAWRDEHHARLSAERGLRHLSNERPNYTVRVHDERSFLYLIVENAGAGAEFWVELSDDGDMLRSVRGVWDEAENAAVTRWIPRGGSARVLLGHRENVAKGSFAAPPSSAWAWRLLIIDKGAPGWISAFVVPGEKEGTVLECLVCSRPESAEGNKSKRLRLIADGARDLDDGTRYGLVPTEAFDVP